MRIRLLGTAAGGGVPQWNCNCPACREARAGTGRVTPRTQSAVAISADDKRWFLLNASPDIRSQIENFPPLHPPASETRGSPIEGVLLTNADLDHTLGLFILREGKKLKVHATDQVRRSLTEGVSIAPTMAFFCGIDWIEPPSRLAPLPCRDGSPSGLRYQALDLNGKPPRFMQGRAKAAPGEVVGYRIVDERTGGRLLFLPDVAQISETLQSEFSECDALLFDGTFWSENEMEQSGVGHALAGSMGHVPISGSRGSLEILARLKIQNKTYVHINNTNPILRRDSAEHTAVKAAGCGIGEDGLELSI